MLHATGRCGARGRGRGPALALLVGGALGLGAPLPATARQAAPREEAAAAEPRSPELEAILRRARDPRERPEELGEEAARLGAALVEPALAILAALRVPEGGGEAAQALSVYQEDVLARALRSVGREAVLAALTEVTGRVEPERVDGLAVRTIGAVGRAEDAPVLLARGERLAQRPWSRSERDAFEGALAALLERDPETQDVLRRAWRSLPDAPLNALLASVGAAGEPRGVRLLADVLDARPDLASACLAQVQRLGPSPFVDVNERLARRLRELLRSGDERAARAACLTAGRLGATDAIPELIDLLESEEHGAHREAGWALRELTGLAFPDTAPRLWRNWFTQETAWFQREAPRAFADLRGSPAQAAAAIAAIGERRLQRDRLALELCAALRHSEAGVRALACAALQRLGSRAACADLAAALRDPDPTVARAAHDALRALSGLDLPPDADAWRAALEAS